MTEHSLWRFSRALHTAINERQHEQLEAMLDDDVEWAIYGPIDMFPFLGSRRGKAAVLDVCRQIADNIRVHRFDRESIMLGVDSASSMIRYSLTALGLQQADQPAARAFRAVQGRAATQYPRADGHLRPGRAGARASDQPAEDCVVTWRCVLLRSPDAAQCAVLHGVCAAEPGSRFLRRRKYRGPDSAKRHEECRIAPGTREM
jgi:hypothetical protein